MSWDRRSFSTPSPPVLRPVESLPALIDQEGLTNVIVLSDGLNVNGSNLVKGLAENLPAGVVITGGLAGDADLFRETYVFWDKEPVRQAVAMIGLYGDHLNVGSASISGWDPFGPERLITKSRENILYELDGQSALNTYKKYLGDAASGLPATALLFPLSVRVPGRKPGIVRTVLSIDEREQTMTLRRGYSGRSSSPFHEGQSGTSHRRRTQGSATERLFGGVGSPGAGHHHQLCRTEARLEATR